MTSLCLIYKSIRKQRKFTEHEYHKHRPRKVLFSEHVYFVQICPVFAGPVTYVYMISDFKGCKKLNHCCFTNVVSLPTLGCGQFIPRS